MRYPKPLKKGGTIGFIAPSFGCAIEPYSTRFENARKIFKEMGYTEKLGSNCYEASGIGISSSPDKCGAELNAAMTDPEIDAIITCGGGELMCEVVPYIDFDLIAKSEPKWYMGYSDNTNFTFLSAVLADTATIYGPCAPAFGRVPWHKSNEDAMKLLSGEISEVSGYELWEMEGYTPEVDEYTPEDEIPEVDPLLSYNATEKVVYRYYLPDDSVSKVNMSGRLIGGCVDILIVQLGTRFDKVAEFLERYKEDGFIWFLECCDLDPLSIRRAFYQMREAGWFKYVKGFMIGRPLHFGEEALGVDQYNAVTDIIGELGVPIVMDMDIGHKPPMMPIICGGYADVECHENECRIRYDFTR
ncbi:Muramoyltetrapeptide carboxypeptidase LdcA (peptidoglycan recycling) [Lachnospiraceae bacterium NE2001]|nr:Muramoyltetrapeptide carboxypeptidase LdcA (peptidoglycan recycling) [Lachnospiraceae bacterium NE2001]